MSRRLPAAARVFETILTFAGGAALGGAVGLPGGVPLGIATGVSAGINGALSGGRRVYDWRSATGWLAFVADSTWGLLGTTLGSALHLVNLAHPRPVYRVDRSRRRNRHAFDRGATLRRGFTFTLGNVVSNASTGEGAPPDRQRLLDRHEGLHIWQSRAFGPLYQVVYLVWFVLGLAAHSVAALLIPTAPGPAVLLLLRAPGHYLQMFVGIIIVIAAALNEAMKSE